MDTYDTANRITLRTLVKKSFVAMVHPKAIFHSLTNTPPDYRTVLPFLGISGVVWIHLHGYLLFTEPIWSNGPRWILYSVLFAMFAISSWLGCGLIVQYALRIFHKRHSIYKIEQGVFVLVMAWLLLPLFDIPHLWVPAYLITLPVVGTHPIHISHVVAAIVIPVELYWFFASLFEDTFWVVVAGAIVSLPIAKFILEDQGFLIEEAFYRMGLIQGKYDDSVFGFITASILCLLLVFLYGLEKHWPKKKTMIIAAIVGFSFFAVGISTIPLMRPVFPGYTTDSGVLDATDGVAKEKDFIFFDRLNFNFDPQKEIITAMQCTVQFVAVTKTTSNESYARCDIAPGPAMGEGIYTFIGGSWNKTIQDTKRATTWRQANALQRLSQSGNDVRIHIKVAPGDIISFSGVWINVETQK